MMKKILLPIDGSEICIKSYEYAKDLAQKYNSKIVILNSQNIVPPFGWVYDPGVSKNPEHDPEILGKKIVEKAKEYFSNTGIEVETMVTTGDPAVAILQVADSQNCDLIIMCTHGMSASKRFLLGSVTNKVVHHANIPVLVIR